MGKIFSMILESKEWNDCRELQLLLCWRDKGSIVCKLLALVL